MSAHKHVFTPLAPEITDSSDPADAETIKWCIRCGTLKIGESRTRPNRPRRLDCTTSGAHTLDD